MFKVLLWGRYTHASQAKGHVGIGLGTRQFDTHVIFEINRTSARIFPAVPDVENPEFKVKLDHLVELNQKLIAIGESDAPVSVKNLQKAPIIAGFAADLLAMFLMKPIDSGSLDFLDFEPQIVY
ncbi:unnamed protein product [Calypogeia fissa]